MSDDERIRAAYAGYAATGRGELWSEANPGYARLARERDAQVVSLIRASATAGARMIDVGCGTGHAAWLIQSTGTPLTYTGLDLLADRVKVAAEAFPWARFITGSADDMPVHDDAFDIALALTLFSSLPSAQLEDGVAREIARVVRPGGWLIWFDLRYDNPSNRAVHGISRQRLAELFPGWAAELRSFTLLPPVARRLGRLTSVAYPLLHALPPLRSHLVGRLRAPDPQLG